MAEAAHAEAARTGRDEPLKEGTEQESLQAILANIFTRRSDDGTPAASTMSGPSTTASDGPSFVSALLSHQAAPSDSPRGDGTIEDAGIASLIKSLQAQQQSSGSAHSTGLASMLKPQGQSSRPVAASPASGQQNDGLGIDNLVNSFLAVNQPEKQQQGGNDILMQLLQSQQSNNTSSSTAGNNNHLIQQLLLAKIQHQQQQEQQQQQQQQQQSKDFLAKLLGSQQQQPPVAAQPCLSGGGGMLADLLGGAGNGGGLAGLSGEEPSSELGDLVNQVLGTRGKPNQADDCVGDAVQFQHHSDDTSHFMQQHHSSGGALKRQAADEPSMGNVFKLRKLADSDVSDEARMEQLTKLRDQLKNLNSANVMLSRYLNGLQGSLSDILAENWSFKILIGCLTSKAESSNPLEQMISARIASNPTVAIPMLKNIHRTATTNNPDEQLEVSSSKNAVFENMVGLLSAQKKTNS